MSKQSAYDSGVLNERERCKRILREMRDAAEARRKGHHATPWLDHAHTAIAEGVDPEPAESALPVVAEEQGE